MTRQIAPPRIFTATSIRLATLEPNTALGHSDKGRKRSLPTPWRADHSLNLPGTPYYTGWENGCRLRKGGGDSGT